MSTRVALPFFSTTRILRSDDGAQESENSDAGYYLVRRRPRGLVSRQEAYDFRSSVVVMLSLFKANLV